MTQPLKTILALSTLFMLSGFIPSNNLSTKDNHIEVVFSQQLKFDDLVEIKNDLAQQNILLNYKSLLFDEGGNLKSIAFEVDCNDGFSGGASTSNIDGETRFGFYRDYTNDTSTPIRFGNLE